MRKSCDLCSACSSLVVHHARLHRALQVLLLHRNLQAANMVYRSFRSDYMATSLQQRRIVSSFADTNRTTFVLLTVSDGFRR